MSYAIFHSSQRPRSLISIVLTMALANGGAACAADDPAKDNAAAVAKGRDRDGDPLPAGVVARLGTKRYRSSRVPVGLAFSPDDRTLVQASENASLQYWEPESGRLLRTASLARSTLNLAPSTPDGRWLATAGFYLDEVRGKMASFVDVVDAVTGKERSRAEVETLADRALAISPDGRLLAVHARSKVQVLDAASGAEIVAHHLDKPSVDALAFSPDGTTVAIGVTQKIILWKWGLDAPVASINYGHDPRVRAHMSALAFSPDGTSLAAGSDDEYGVMLFDVGSGKELRKFVAPGITSWYPRTIQFSPDGKRLATTIEGGNFAGGAVVWETETAKLIWRLEAAQSNIYQLAYSHDGRRLAGASRDGLLAVWDLESGLRLGRDLPGHAWHASTLCFLPDDQRLVSSGDDGTVRVWELPTQQQLRLIHAEPDDRQRLKWIRAMDVSPDGKRIATSSLDDTVRLWDTDSGREIYRLAGHGELGGVRALRFSPDGQWFASWGDDLRMYRWDFATGKALSESKIAPIGGDFPLARDWVGRHFDFSCSQPFSPDASRLIVPSNGNIFVLSTSTGKEIAKFPTPVARFNRFAISADGQSMLQMNTGPGRKVKLADGREGGAPANYEELRLTNLTNGATVRQATLDGKYLGPVAFSPDGSRAAICNAGDTPFISILKLPQLVEVARLDKIAGRVWGMQYSHSGKLLAVATGDSSIWVWDTAAAVAPPKR